ncbi:DUF6527 family protein [Roseinatronobacter sp. NSM]|uniref:DUF6527 family protein n=1 Tax=Roseinatronobacter sp. NSM TaxID=3457785 RepID=UPI004036ED75
MAIKNISHQFVGAIPEHIKEGVLYLAMDYATAIHKCACGCGREVVTPFSPTDWKMGYDGVSVSLSPSIGNWSFPCRSHYWIKHSNIRWAGDMTDEQVAAGRQQDRRSKDRYFKTTEAEPRQKSAETPTGFWQRIVYWFRRK